MSAAVQVNVTGAAAAAASIAALRAALSPRRLLKTAATAAAALVVANFVALNSARHRFGQNYYAQAADGTSWHLVSDELAQVDVNHEGIGQRYYGGTIKAGANGSGKKWLPIAARDEAQGHGPGEFTDLVFVQFRPDLAALVQRQRAKGDRARDSITPGVRGKDSRETGGLVFYWLKKEVTQKPDPTVLPTQLALETAARDAIAADIAAARPLST